MTPFKAGVLAVTTLVLFAFFGFTKANPFANPYELKAMFRDVQNLKTRAPVVISGVKVGQVGDIALAEDYRARVMLDLSPALQLPTDTSASIVTAGVLGDRYVSLQLGGDPA